MLCACFAANAQSPMPPAVTASTRIAAIQTATAPPLQLDSLRGLAATATETIDVELEGVMLQMATKFLTKDDPTDNDPEDRAEKAALREALGSLRGVYVKGFEFEKAGDYAANLAPIRAQLRAAPWKRIAEVRDRKKGAAGDTESIEVYAANDGVSEKLGGLAVLIGGAKELMVVNVVGAIDIDTLVKLAPSIGIPQLKDLNKQINRPPAGNAPPNRLPK